MTKARWGLEATHPSVGAKYVLIVEIFPVILHHCFPLRADFLSVSRYESKCPFKGAMVRRNLPNNPLGHVIGSVEMKSLGDTKQTTMSNCTALSVQSDDST